MKTKNNLKAALGKSLKSEEEAVKSKYDKFSKADIVIDDYEKGLNGSYATFRPSG